MRELSERYRDQGLVLIGVHTTNGAEKMPAFAKEHGVTWPIAADVDKKTVRAFGIDSFPDYCLIDRQGKLRVVDLANGDLDRAVKVLLAEGASVGAKKSLESTDAMVVLGEAFAQARASGRKLLVHLGGPG